MIKSGNTTKSGYRTVWPVFGVFFCESAVLGSWIPRIPDIKDQFLLSDAMLGVCLLVIPLGTITAFLVASRLLQTSGMRNGCRLWLPIWALTFLLPALVTSQLALLGSLLLAGFTIGMCEVSMNTKADMVEADVGFRIMSRCHGFWSLGSMAGALVGSTMAEWGWSLFEHYTLVLPLLAFSGYVVATALPPDQVDVVADSDPDSGMDVVPDHTFRLPTPAILLLCLMPVGVMLVEGAFIDWSALFMREILDASPMVIGITYAFFSVVMAITRLAGDAIAETFGDRKVVFFSGIAAFAGLAVFASSSTVPLAMLGATLAGLGVAIVYPLAITAAARRPGNVSDNVASISLIAFVAFLLAPPFIGFVSDHFGLRLALLLLLPVVALTPILSREIEKRD